MRQTRRRVPVQRYSPPSSPLRKRRRASAASDVSSYQSPPSQSAAVQSSSSPSPSLTVSAADNANKSNTTFSLEQVQILRQRLLDWYVDNHRELPWRAPPRHQKNGKAPKPMQNMDCPSSPGAPYAVWISEVMSQQTRLSVVVQYYKRWMQELPSVKHLAEAPLERVYELWAGLGYYRRARFAHEAAKQIVDQHDGRIPGDVNSLLKLCGIGRYTAGAVSSIAFGHAVAAVDGNVERVLSRLRSGLSQNCAPGKERSRAYWEVASACVEDIENAGDLNQALMEVGASVCKPKGAQCEKCPLTALCDAYQEAQRAKVEASSYVSRYPMKDKTKRIKVRSETVIALVVFVQRGGRREVLLRRREGDGLLGGLWETPNRVVDWDLDDCGDEAFREVLREVDGVAGVCCGENGEYSDLNLVDAGQVRHVFSHIRQRLVVKALKVEVTKDEAGRRGDGYRWVSETEVEKCAISKQMRKVVDAALKKA
ncbi:Adenine DNA glycosylase [Gracilariopsis chorda]|uniref:Adenine DNA glycosylase n=1 Tax=Gracilariopsis chorda TaxID=448386 RepID=A0A2V3J2U2_9FLOR|nr:Adenine DNA glycosylase [Gracilariopsis chorda]|eukprot:PXF48699.1 Adenine DNA glycosylase [Gracilariopsis chorda]